MLQQFSKLTVEELEQINFWLRDKYGYFAEFHPKYRVIWSDDEIEKRKGDFDDRTESGIFIRTTKNTVREVKKYPWIESKYVLERCFENTNPELVTKLTYEPIWTFHDKQKNPLIPDLEVLWYLIETIHTKEARAIGARYKDPESTMEGSLEEKRKRIEILKQKLFGNETPIGDALMQQSGVSISKTDMWEKK